MSWPAGAHALADPAISPPYLSIPASVARARRWLAL